MKDMTVLDFLPWKVFLANETFLLAFFSQAYVKKKKKNQKVTIGSDTLYSFYSMPPLHILGLQARDKAAMLVVNKITLFCNIEFT